LLGGDLGFAHVPFRIDGQAKLSSAAAGQSASGSYGIGKGGLDVKAALFWTLVGVPLAWGIWQTAAKAFVLFQ
jgi:hypothetical protein